MSALDKKRPDICPVFLFFMFILLEKIRSLLWIFFPFPEDQTSESGAMSATCWESCSMASLYLARTCAEIWSRNAELIG